MDANRILLQSLYKKIIIEFSRATEKTLDESMYCFYNSTTYDLISNGIGDMHCRGVKYLTDELLLEYGIKEQIGYPSDASNH